MTGIEKAEYTQILKAVLDQLLDILRQGLYGKKILLKIYQTNIMI